MSCKITPFEIRFVNFERDAKLKGPRHSTGQASVNCASGKYHSSPIKIESLDTNLGTTGVKQGPCRGGLIGSMPPVKVLYTTLTRLLVVISIMHLGMEWSGVKSRCGKSRSGRRISGVLPTRKLAWHLGCSLSQPRFLVGASCQYRMHPLGKQSSELIV